MPSKSASTFVDRAAIALVIHAGPALAMTQRSTSALRLARTTHGV